MINVNAKNQHIYLLTLPKPDYAVMYILCCFFHVLFVSVFKVHKSRRQNEQSDTVSSLLAFPTIAMAFRKSNATLPSSAAVERLFSAASQVLCSRRCQMSDEMLDKLVFLQSRLKIWA